MSYSECQLCELLLNQHFGEIVGKVGGYLAKNGKLILPQILAGVKIPVIHVRKALCVLIQHNVVDCKLHRQRYVQYHLHSPKVINLIFYPKIIQTVKSLYGNIGEKIVEEILKNGMSRMSVILKSLKQSIPENAKINKVFEELVKTHFLIRKPMVKIEDGDAPQVLPEYLPNDKTMFEIPNEDVKSGDSEPNSKRRKVVFEKEVDDGIFWIVNIPRFHRYFRDQEIISAITYKFGIDYGEITRSILRISEVTTSPYADVTQPLTSNEIFRSVHENFQNLSAIDVLQSLKLLTADSDGIITNSDDRNENLYSVNFKNGITELVTSEILSYILEKFGKKGCRIFRLLLAKKHLEQKQIEDIAMIPSKEAKELQYAMLAENLLTLQEVPKSVDHAPSRTYFMFAANVPKIVRTLLDMTYKSLTNLIMRWNKETENNKRLIDKREKVDTIKANLQDGTEEQLQEIEEMMTESETTQLKRSQLSAKKLDLGQAQIANTILLFNFFLNIDFHTKAPVK